MNEHLIARLAEAWGNLDPVDPLRSLVSDAIDVLQAHLAQRQPLTDEQIMAIGREMGLKCKLGGNPNIDFEYARAIEAALGITGEAK